MLYSLVRHRCNFAYLKVNITISSASVFRGMSGKIVPNDWFGGLRILYCTGPGHEDNRYDILVVC